MLNKTIASRSFWDSQLAAAIIGAGSAILIVIMQYLWKRHKQQKEELDKIYSWIVESYNFWTPDSLLTLASEISYGGTTTDNLSGEKRIIPEKPLGEKMVIELRKHVKYWQFPSWILKWYFKKYEKSLRLFNTVDPHSNDEFRSNLLFSESIMSKIKKIAFKRSGENEWTI